VPSTRLTSIRASPSSSSSPVCADRETRRASTHRASTRSRRVSPLAAREPTRPRSRSNHHRAMTTNSLDAAKHAAVARYDAWSRALLGDESPRETFERRFRYERARDRALGMDWWREEDDIEPQSTDDARRSVAMDVERLPSDDPRKKSTRCVGALKRLLVTHAMVTSSSGGYKQGMHEVASMVLDVRVSAAEYSRAGAVEDRWDDDSEDQRTIYGERVILEAGPRDFRFIEHDSFALFHALLGHDRKDGRFALSTYYGDASRPASPINGAFRRIEGALRVMDEKLAKRLSDLGVEPQLYLLRWLRLGYGREFRRREVLTLWDAIFDRSVNSGANADASLSRDIYEGIAVSVLMSMRNDILEMTDFGEVMSRIQTVPRGIELSHMIARAKAFAMNGLLTSHEEDGMKVFFSKKQYSTPPSLKKNRLVVPGILGKSNSPRWDDTSSVHSLDSLSVEIAGSANRTDSDDDTRQRNRTTGRPIVDKPTISRSSASSEATPLRVPRPTSSRTPTRRSSLSNTSRENKDEDRDRDDDLDDEKHAFMGSMFSTNADCPPRPPPSRNASSPPPRAAAAATTTRTPTTTTITHDFTTETPEHIARSRADARRHLRAALRALALAEDDDSAASVRVALSRLDGAASPS